MVNLLEKIRPILLMGPGPSSVFPEAMAALAKPTLGHLDPLFLKIMDGLKARIQTVAGTKNNYTFALSATGMGGMEAVFTNLIEAGDRVLVIVNGVFGKRQVEIAQRLGAKVDEMEFEWGTPVLPDKVAEQLKKGPYAIVSMVHAETSTGVLNPAAEVSALVKNHGALMVLDCVTSMGGLPVKVDEWKIDAMYSGSQKCLGCVSGMSPATFSEEAVAKVKARKTKVPNFYLDILALQPYWEGEKRAYHHTACSNLYYALYASLDAILKEGLEGTYSRHHDAHERLVKGVEAMGLSMYVKPGARLPMLNTITVPAGCDEAKVRNLLLDEHDIEIGAGLGPLAGKIFRVGVMGQNARPEAVDTFLKAFAATLK